MSTRDTSRDESRDESTPPDSAAEEPRTPAGPDAAATPDATVGPETSAEPDAAVEPDATGGADVTGDDALGAERDPAAAGAAASADALDERSDAGADASEAYAAAEAATAAQADTVALAEEAAEAQPTRTISRGRRIGIDVLLVVTTILAVVAMLSIWANRLLFNPDNWANTSTQLLQDPNIRSATANFLVDELYSSENVPKLIHRATSALPTALQPLVAPVEGAIRPGLVQVAELALSRPRVQNLWAQANRAADEEFIHIVEGGHGALKLNNGVVSLDLATLVTNLASQLGIGANLGSHLPPSANLTIFKSDQLKYIQDGGKALKGLALLLTILVPLLYALAILLAPGRRRRTLMAVGFSVVFAGILGVAARALLQSQIPNTLVKDASLRPAVLAVITISTGMFSEIATAFILVGLVFIVAAWFAGPSRISTRARRFLAPYLREHPGGAFGVVAAIMVLIFIWQPIPATGKPVGIIVFFLLAMLGTELLRRQTAQEFPKAESEGLLAAGAGRFRRPTVPHANGGAPATAESLPEQLARLATLRDEGVLTAAEYDAAKGKLLHA